MKNRSTQILIGLLLTCVACTSTTYFRPLTREETKALAAARKQVNLKDGRYHVLMVTDAGNLILKLYNETPLHRDNLVSKVKAGFYDSLVFHRVINNFVIQGGDPDSKRATAETKLGEGEAPGPKIPAEFRTDQAIFHKRGALGMARDNNPEKASSNSQFYIVQRKAYRPAQLDSFVVQRKLTLTEAQRQLYTTQGGTPHLDGGYTVFGELEIGWDVLDKIAAVKTDKSDRPFEPVRMRLFLLNEIKK
ncbi:MAG: peptidylprolyl isomerase [Cyclobacteriaceae bacterium]|jgi:cyclophilin family peptidyl-prolyl cis-trans isomerase